MISAMNPRYPMSLGQAPAFLQLSSGFLSESQGLSGWKVTQENLTLVHKQDSSVHKQTWCHGAPFAPGSRDKRLGAERLSYRMRNLPRSKPICQNAEGTVDRAPERPTVMLPARACSSRLFTCRSHMGASVTYLADHIRSSGGSPALMPGAQEVLSLTPNLRRLCDPSKLKEACLAGTRRR